MTAPIRSAVLLPVGEVVTSSHRPAPAAPRSALDLAEEAEIDAAQQVFLDATRGLDVFHEPGRAALHAAVDARAVAWRAIRARYAAQREASGQGRG